MRNRIIKSIICLMAAVPFMASASPITPGGALNRLRSQNHARMKGMLQTSNFNIYEIVTDSCGNNTVYLFDSKDGFVVTPADDAFPALLGYGESQMYDSDGNLPIGFREWLQFMSLRISEDTAGENEASVNLSVGEAIAPLCRTSWGQ